MQFPVGVALRDLANFAADQVTRAISQQMSFPFSHPLCGAKQPFRLVSSKYIFLKAKRTILVQNRKRERRRSKVAGKGGKSGQSADSGFQHAQSIM